MHPTKFLAIVPLVLLLSSCGEEPKKAAEQDLAATEEQATKAELEKPAFQGTVLVAPENAKLVVYEAPQAPQFKGATMGLQVKPDHAKMDAEFEYNITNYQLAAQTEGAKERGCANSDQGQHIHFILNNAPYLAKYDSKFREAVQPGANVLLSFLSRSYHESLKEPGAFVVTTFNMKGKSDIPEVNVYNDPLMFYSRPKGEYKKSSGDKVLLDFFVVNCTMAPTGYRVKATIDGETWTLNKWTAYFIEGLQVGDHTVELQLIDSDGKNVPGPFNNSGKRTFKVLEG